MRRVSRRLSWIPAVTVCATALLAPVPSQAQAPAPSAVQAPPAAATPAARPARVPPPRTKKRILVLGAAIGWQHDSIPDGMAMVFNLGHETGAWEAYLRTDYASITKKSAGPNAKNLDAFDALVFVNTTGEMTLDADQKRDLLAFVHDDGKGFVGIHAALDANYQWPEYGEMIGGWFDEHPWNTFDAPILREDADFPATRHLPRAFVKHDEIYQAKSWSREKVNVLLRLDESQLTYDNNPRVHRTDRDFAVAWAKMYGKGRVFYSTLGHTPESFVDPDVRTMYFEAIKWALGLSEGSTSTHTKPAK
jgi:type 1 glutamine amidotransferase